MNGDRRKGLGLDTEGAGEPCEDPEQGSAVI